MLTQNNPKNKSDLEILKSARQGNKKKIFVAIAVVIILTVVAMTGVYYEYW